MIKPIKPKKPLKYSSPPNVIITVSKLLVYDTENKKYRLIDEICHPEVFRDPKDNTINNELFPYYDVLEQLHYEWDMKELSYKNYQQIYEDCNIPVDDFVVYHKYNEDGYYDNSIVQYKIEDPDYNSKVIKYNNRFVEYERQLAVYDNDMKKYTEYKNSEKKKRLVAELNKL